MLWLRKIYFIVVLTLSSTVLADGLYLGLGGYSLSAKVGSNETSLSNLSFYQLSYSKKIMTRFSFDLGYSLLFEDLLGGDASFGPNVGFRYYPYGVSTHEVSALNDLSFEISKTYNPYIKLGFMQRDFQSVASSYSGFYFGGGVESGWIKNFSVYSDLSYSILNGPVKGEATEMSAVVGIIYNNF